jgi:hypothetical protein
MEQVEVSKKDKNHETGRCSADEHFRLFSTFTNPTVTSDNIVRRITLEG